LSPVRFTTMANVLTSILSTELEALNAVLRAVGEAPAAAVTDTHQYVTFALATLRDTLRETLAKGWKFNTDRAFRIAKESNDTFLVPTEAAGDPGDLLRFEVTSRPDQVGRQQLKQEDGTFNGHPQKLDIAVRGSTFWHRILNKNDFGDATDRPQIFIDAVWSYDFTDCPESVKRFVVVSSGRQMAQEVLGSREHGKFKERDEARAWAELVRDQGIEDDEANILNSIRSSTSYGYRRSNWLR
jgi:hypothetical protein